MSPLLFDLIVAALFLLSIVLGFMRGFVNEVFTIFGWIGAVLATLFFTPALKPFGREFIHNPILADLATASMIFIVTMIAFSAISHLATRTIHLSQLGIVDRILGFGFGILRAVVFFGLVFTLFNYVFTAETQPDFVKNARSRPFLEASAQWVQAIMPGDLVDTADKKQADKTPTDTKPAETKEPQKSGSNELDRLRDNLVPEFKEDDKK